jgi:hypothetical protein
MIPPPFLPALLLPFLNCTAARNPGDENPKNRKKEKIGCKFLILGCQTQNFFRET